MLLAFKLLQLVAIFTTAICGLQERHVAQHNCNILCSCESFEILMCLALRLQKRICASSCRRNAALDHSIVLYLLSPKGHLSGWGITMPRVFARLHSFHVQDPVAIM
jgi:hypothetical protein